MLLSSSKSELIEIKEKHEAVLKDIKVKDERNSTLTNEVEKKDKELK